MVGVAGNMTLVFGGVIAGLGTVALMARFLNSKIDTQNTKLNLKQDKAMCNQVVETFKESMHKGDEKFDKIMETLTDIQITNGQIKSQLKYMNGNSKKQTP